MYNILLIAGVLGGFLSYNASFAKDTQECPAGFTSLFNGKDLTGWSIHQGLPDDEVHGKWYVENGVITGMQNPPGKGGLLTTSQEFQDFELQLEAKIDWPFDTGIFLRVGPHGESHQVTLDYRPEGEIGGIYCSPGQGWVKHCEKGILYYKKDRWNKIRIICQGEPARIRVWLNDALITDLQHTKDTTKGIPEKGTLCIQVHPGEKGFENSKTQFRNIFIRELGPDPDRVEGVNNWTFSVTNVEQGYLCLFNRQDLTGWDGDPRLWSVEDSVIRGEITDSRQIKENTFLIWRAGAVENFILQLKFRIQNGNSGVQYRCYDRGLWKVFGYQAEVCNCQDVGFLYDEGYRARLVEVGESVESTSKEWKQVIGTVCDPNRILASYIPQEWNEYRIVARGNHIMHYLNGIQTVELFENYEEFVECHSRGLIALQIHTGKPMQDEFKDIYLKHLPAWYGNAIGLLNGNDLEGWQYLSDEASSSWTVKNGVLVHSGEKQGVIQTLKEYDNFILRMQYRHLEPGDSGVLLRMSENGNNGPYGVKLQLKYGAVGDIIRVHDFPIQGDSDRVEGDRIAKFLDSAEYELGQWNDYEAILDRGQLTIYLNGLLQNSATGCLQKAGKIGLQSDGNTEYRNIVLIPICPDNQ